jgi:hypothetical protein
VRAQEQPPEGPPGPPTEGGGPPTEGNEPPTEGGGNGPPQEEGINEPPAGQEPPAESPSPSPVESPSPSPSPLPLPNPSPGSPPPEVGTPTPDGPHLISGLTYMMAAEGSCKVDNAKSYLYCTAELDGYSLAEAFKVFTPGMKVGHHIYAGDTVILKSRTAGRFCRLDADETLVARVKCDMALYLAATTFIYDGTGVTYQNKTLVGHTGDLATLNGENATQITLSPALIISGTSINIVVPAETYCRVDNMTAFLRCANGSTTHGLAPEEQFIVYDSSIRPSKKYKNAASISAVILRSAITGMYCQVRCMCCICIGGARDMACCRTACTASFASAVCAACVCCQVLIGPRACTCCSRWGTCLVAHGGSLVRKCSSDQQAVHPCNPCDFSCMSSRYASGWDIRLRAACITPAAAGEPHPLAASSQQHCRTLAQPAPT